MTTLPLSLLLDDKALDLIANRVLARLPRPDEDAGYLTAKGAADYLGLTTGAVRKLEQRGELRGYRPNGSVFFDRAELAAWVRGTTSP